jgi:glycosyltransferase involved in cell wall biosynthesis
MIDNRRVKQIAVLHVVGGLDSAGGLMYVATALARNSVSGITSFVWKHRDFVPTSEPGLFVCCGSGRRTDQNIVADVARAFIELPALLRWIRREKNVILHAHTRVGMISSAIASKIRGCPLVIHFHAFSRQTWFYRWLLKWTGATALFTSARTARHFGFEPERSLVMMPCIPWPEKPADKMGPKRFVAAASFVAWKKLDVIINAFNLLRQGGEKVDLVLFGRSNRPFREQEQEKIVSLARQYPAVQVKEHDVYWMSQLTASDVFVHAADQEPFGIVILEAFSRGCRCVVPTGTFLDELPEPLRSQGVWRVNPVDEHSLAHQLEAAMAMPLGADKLWQARRAIAVEFSVQNAALKLSTVYESMLS